LAITLVELPGRKPNEKVSEVRNPTSVPFIDHQGESIETPAQIPPTNSMIAA
jgi:hypothetical protein